MKETNRSELRKIIMTVLYQISVYKSNKIKWFKCPLHIEHDSEEKRISQITSGHFKHLNCKQCSSIGQYVIDNYGEEFLWKVWLIQNSETFLIYLNDKYEIIY